MEARDTPGRGLPERPARTVRCSRFALDGQDCPHGRRLRHPPLGGEAGPGLVNSAVLLPASFAILLAGALLFTNAIEWFGSMVGLGQGAVGSLLAAVATALPESLIPVVAIVGGEQGSDDVAVGAIIGAPLLLATLAMALAGIA